MKCERCTVSNRLDDCPFFDEYGTEWKDGQYGCTLHPSTLKKLENEHDNYYAIMGLEMGMEYDFKNHNISMEKAIEDGKHMIGMDGRHKPYTRHGKRFYKPWRNYFTGYNEAFEWMANDVIGLCRKVENDMLIGGVGYSFTRNGLDWLGRQIGVVIHDVKK